MQIVEASIGLPFDHRTPPEMTTPVETLVFTPTMVDNNWINMATGDLGHRDHSQVVAIVNNALDNQTHATLEAHGSLIPPYAVAKGKKLREGIDSLKQATVRAELTPQAEELAKRYQKADANATNIDDRIIQRLGDRRRRYISDVDGTLTTDPQDYLERLIPGSTTGEEILREHGRESFPEAFAAAWHHGIKVVPESFRNAGRQVPLRPGVNDAIRYFHDRGDSFEVLSANFVPFVEGVVRDKIPAAKNIKITAVASDDITAIEKGDILKQTAIANPEASTVYIGDGSSDLPSIEAKDFVALYFALEGSSFAQQLEERNVPHYTYKTFDDIREKMQVLDAKTGEMIQPPQKELQPVA